MMESNNRKYILLLLFLLLHLSINAQKHGAVRIGTSSIAVVFNTKTGLPIKAYADVTDCSQFMRANMNKSYMYQDVNLHYKEVVDTTKWQPNNKILLDAVWNPEPLNDQYLAKDSVYIVMQEHFDIADRAYTISQIDDCIKYADNFKLKYYKVLFLYRDKKSYDRVYQIKKNKLQRK